MFVVPAVRQRERLNREQSRVPAQGASRLCRSAAGPWTAVQSTCQTPCPTAWMSACPSVDKRATPDKSLKVNSGI